MFLAWHDLRHARGRFALVTSVVALITLLVALLAALTAGLGRASTSAVVDLPADRLAFSTPDEVGADPTFTQSQVTEEQWTAWAATDGVSWAQPLGVAPTRATSSGAAGTTAAVTALGVEPGSPLLPEHPGGTGPGSLVDGTVVLSHGAAEALAAVPGDDVTIAASTLAVVAVTAQDADLAHTPVVWITLADWQSVGAHATSSTTGPVATVVALGLSASADPVALATADSRIGTTTLTLAGSRSAVGSYAAEHLSLTMMQVFLLVISALVVGVFFTVWTIDRGRDIAVVKALGGSTGYLVRDAIGQAAVVLVLGAAVGAGLATVTGLLAATVMPVVVAVSTVVVPAALLTVLGLVGATVSIARIATVEPHSALAAR